MRCLSCNYDLRNLAERRCPECGRVFDPQDTRTFAPRWKVAPGAIPGWIVATLFLLGSCILPMLLLALLQRFL